MTISKREKYIGIGMGAAILLLLLDQVVLSPFLKQLDDISAQTDAARTKVDDMTSTFAKQSNLKKVWTAMQTGGLKDDESQAQSQALRAVLDWAQNAGVNLAALKPERSQAMGQFQVISFHITGTSSTPSLARLLYGMETATIPVRVNDIQITPVKEGTDNLTVQLSVSTLCMLQTDAKPPAAPLAMND